MSRGFFAGAGIVAALDLALRLPLTAAGYWREVALLVCLAALLVGVLASLVARGCAAALPGAPPAFGTAFWIGAAVAATPSLGALLPKPIFGLVLPVLVLPIAGRLGRFWAPSRGFGLFLGLLPLLVLPGLLLMPGLPAPELPPVSSAALAAAGSPGAGPDVILISCDTLRADVFDEAELELPNLRALRQRGTWAPYAVAASSSTRPSHVTMLSGLPPFAHAVTDNKWKMGQDVQLVSQRFQDAGWRTAAVVSNAMISARSGFDRGFEVFDETPIVRRHFRNEDLSASPFSLGYFLHPAKKGTWWGWLGLLSDPVQDRLLVDWKGLPPNRGNGAYTLLRAMPLLEQLQAGDQPFFFFLHFMDPHTPYRAPERFSALPEATRDCRETLGEGGSDIGEWTAVNGIERLSEEQSASAGDLIAKARAAYLEEVRYMDSLIGEIMAQIEQGGRPTVLLFTADHGEQFGEHGLMLHSNSLWEPALRVPWILVGPEVPARQLESPPQLEDVAPTLLAAAGLPAEGFAGRSLLAGPLPPRPQISRYHEFLAVRDGDWKLILEAGEDGEFVPTGLFDLATDPQEQIDRRQEEAETLARLAKLAEAALEVERAVSGVEADHDPEHLGALAELGYLDN